MHKKSLRIFFLITILLFMPFSSVVIASEFENIDSFDVHPVNRWAETVVGITASISGGLLNMSDVGDGSQDTYHIIRDIRDTSGTVEFRAKWNSNSSTGTFADAGYIRLLGSGGLGGNNGWYLYAIPKTGSYCYTSMSYFSGGIVKTKLLADSEQIYTDLWYRLRIDYNLLESELRIRLYHDNDTKVFDYNWYDWNTARPDMFSETVLSCAIRAQSKDNIINYYVDYVKAPFKEREWTQIDTPADADYLSDEWNVAWAQDDIDELSTYTLTVPYFDVVSGVLRVELPNRDHATFTTAGDRIGVVIYVYTVDYDDGDLTEAVAIQLSTYEDAGGDNSDLEVELDNVAAKTLGAITDTSADISQCTFSIASMNDRSSLSVQLEVEFDGVDQQRFYGEVALSDVSATASQEFLLKITYVCDLDKNTEIMAGVTSFDLLEKDIFSDTGNFIDELIGVGQAAAQGGIDFLQAIFVWLGGLITSAFDVVIAGLQVALETALGAVETAIGSVQTAVEAVTTAIGELAAQVATAIWDGVGAAMDAVITAFQGLASDIADLIFDILDLLLDLILDLADEIWALIQGIIFSIWTTLGLPDLLGMFDQLLTGLGLMVDGFGQFVTDMNTLIDNIFTLSVAGGLFIFFFLPITISPTIGGWIEKVLQFLSFDITFGLSAFGFGARIPVGAVWLAIVIGSGVLSGSILGGFL